MPDNHYEDARLAAIYDLDSGWSADRQFYLDLAGTLPLAILDVGCGTGLLCNEYAKQGHQVTAVEPSAAMLAVGRTKPFGKQIEWVQACAQDFALNKQFDLIIMTGHAFQVLQTEDDILLTLKNMRNHLKPDGRIVFESRNPLIDWSKNWNYEIKIALPDGGTVNESRRFISMEKTKMLFELRYQFLNELLISNSQLQFWTQSQIEQYAAAAGLSSEKILGDWNGHAFDENESEEIIVFLRKTNAKN